MAKRNSTRRKARKPKIIDVRGHQLTEAMYADYQRRIERRADTNHGSKPSQIEDLAFGDFLAGYRPSMKVKQRLGDVYHQASSTAIAIGTLQGYTFYTGDPEIIRAGGCDLLKKLALELYDASAKLTAIAMSVESEGTTKLQDWVAADDAIARIGRPPEVAHG